MTETQQEMFLAMMFRAAGAAGDYCRDNGYPPPGHHQISEMNVLWTRAFEAFLSGFAPERDLTAAELEAIEAAIVGAAHGAVLRVVGCPPGSESNQN